MSRRPASVAGLTVCALVVAVGPVRRTPTPVPHGPRPTSGSRIEGRRTPTAYAAGSRRTCPAPSTLIAPDLNGVVGVRDSPSDGLERHVANGLAVTYAP
jgi:hypothetical protein